jgi:hypothetical protein
MSSCDITIDLLDELYITVFCQSVIIKGRSLSAVEEPRRSQLTPDFIACYSLFCG